MPNNPYIVCQYESGGLSRWSMVSEVAAESLEMGAIFAIWLRQCPDQSSLCEFLQRLLRNNNLIQDEDVPVLPDATFQALRLSRVNSCGSRTIRSLILSRETLREFDALMAPFSIERQGKILSHITSFLQLSFYLDNCSISIDFSEVFLVEPNQALPAHYRPDIDRVVTTIEDYQQQTSLFSYQLAKAFFGAVIRSCKPIGDQCICEPYLYAGLKNLPAQNHFYASLANNPIRNAGSHPSENLNRFVSNQLTHILEVMDVITHHVGSQIILRFGPQINLRDMIHCKEALTHCRHLKEMILILTGPDYTQPSNREAVLHTLEELVVSLRWRFFPHVFLLTQQVSVNFIQELATEPFEQNGFRRLKHDRGYYLSDARVFAAVYRNQQSLVQKNSSPLNQIFSESNTVSKYPSTYIIHAGLPAERYRQSKRFDAKQLKAQLSFSVTQQYAQTRELTQNQTLQQEQVVSQQQELTQTQGHQHQQQLQRQSQFGVALLRNTITFHRFQSQLLERVMLLNLNPDKHTKRMGDNGFYTEFHYKTNLMSRLIDQEAFRLKVTCSIFGRWGRNPAVFGLGKHSFVQIDNWLGQYILDSIEHLVDGLDPELWEIEEGFFALMLPLYRFATLISYPAIGHEAPIHYDSDHLSGFGLGASKDFQPVIQPAALLREEDISSDESAESLRNMSHILSAVFEPNCPQILEDDASLCQQVQTLFQVHCPASDLSPLSKFLGSFPKWNRDYLKIMLYPLVAGYRHNAEQFLTLINELEQRALLDNFRRIYFEYATTIFTVTDLLTASDGPFWLIKLNLNPHKQFISSAVPRQRQHLFLELAQRTPIGADWRSWPPFEMFAHHFLLYTSKLNINTQSIDLKTLLKWWQRFEAKLVRYHQGDRTAAEESLRLFSEKIICSEQGLSIAPVCVAQTILNGLEKLIDNAMQHGMLEEQLVEWEGVSVLRTDAVHAGAQDGFGVVTKEMALDITQLLPIPAQGDTSHLADNYKDSYRFSGEELNILLHEQCIVENGHYPTFIIKIFRYLGLQSLREPIAFYRGLLEFKSEQTDAVYVYFRYMLFGYFVSTKTGAHYSSHQDDKALHADFMRYLLQKNYIPSNDDYVPAQSMSEREDDPNDVMRRKISGEYHGVILACVEDFCCALHSLKIDTSQHNHFSLWGFYVQCPPSPPSLDSSLTWLGLSQTPTFETIPDVFKKKFAIQNLAKFFFVHQEALLKASGIFNRYPQLLNRLMVAKIRETFAETVANKGVSISPQIVREKKLVLYQWLSSIQPCRDRDIALFIHGLIDLETLVADYSELALEEDYDLLIKPLTLLLNQHRYLKTGLQIVQLIAQQRYSEHYNAQSMCALLTALQRFPVLMQGHWQVLVPLISAAYMTYTKPAWLLPLLTMTQKLVDFEASQASNILRTLLAHCPWQKQELPFFLASSLSAQQLQGLAQFFANKSLNDIVLARLLHDNPLTNFSELRTLFQSCDQDNTAAIAHLAQYIDGQNSDSMFQILTQCNTHPKQSLVLLARLVDLYRIEPSRVQTMMYRPNLKQEIRHLEQELYAQNLERFTYDPKDVAEKIGKIRKKSMVEGEEDQSLTPAEQALLLKDYQIMMSYMLENPVLIEENQQGERRPLTIHQLDEAQCKLLYQRLSAALQDPAVSLEKKHAYRLTLQALCSEAHYRTTKKFPRDTQTLCELHGLDAPNSQIQEVKTGGGKSIISEIRAMMLCAEKWTVDIATENMALAQIALDKFKLYYDYLGVPFAKTVIKSDSPHSAYVEFGIHHSTPANFSFYRANMALKKKNLPTRVALLCDEIDAVLTTTIQYRLAGVLDPIYTDMTSWAVVLKEMLAFVREDTIFLQNNCDAQDDVHNFRLYFSLHQPDKKLTQFVEKIPQAILDKLLNSARMPQALQEGVDYLSILMHARKKPAQYAAPILNVGTKRPEPSVSCSDGVQQFLHIEQNGLLPKEAIPFVQDAITETLLIISAKNFFDFYPLVIGWTGTPGAKTELQEFFQENRLQAHYYPVFYQDLSANLGTVIVETREQQHASVLEKIRAQRAQKLGQPLILIVDSPKALDALQLYLQRSADDLLVQTYDGYDNSGISEQDIIQRAGEENTVTITTLSLTRGTDFESHYPQGICELNTAADITESEAIQLEGRVARNGKPGQFAHIICAEDLDSAMANDQDSAARFNAHQRAITLKRQQERLKTRFLENCRYHVVAKYFLRLRQEADRILTEQQGIYASLISEKDFLLALRDFNKQAEDIYSGLLGAQKELNSDQKEEFIRQLVGVYQNSIDALVGEQDLQNFVAIEPLIALPGLITAPLPAQRSLRDLQAVSDILSSGWRTMGNQPMVRLWEMSEDVLTEFQPYFDGDCSIRFAAAQTLEKRGMLKIPKVIAELDHIKVIINDFEWDDAINHVQRGIMDNTEDRVMRAMASMVSQIFSRETIQQCKDFALNYVTTTQTQIAEKRWDDLALPDFNLAWIQLWLGRIQTIFYTFSWITWGTAFVAGPIPFIVTRFVLPTILSWVKTLVKRWFADSESTMVQVLLGLDDAFTDISKVLTVLCNKDLKTLTIDEMLQDFAPLFKNKAIQMLLNKMFESPENGDALFQLLPDLIQALEPYRHLPCTDLKKPEILMTIMVKILQSDAIKQMMDAEEYGVMLQRIDALPIGFSQAFKDCSLPQMLSVIKVLAHPRFNEFLTELPPEADFQDLVLCLQSDTDAAPALMQTPLRKLREYQGNHERIAQDSQLAYRNIKHKFRLREEDMHAYQASLTQPIPAIEPPEVPQALWLSILDLQLTKLIITYAILLLVNYVLFNFSAVLVTGTFFALFVIPVLYQLITANSAVFEDVFAKGIIPPFILTVPPHEDVIALNEPAMPNSLPQPAVLPQASAYPLWTVFGSLRAQLNLPNLPNLPFLTMN